MRAADHLPSAWNAADHFINRHVREGRGDRIAIVTDEGEVSFAQLDEHVRRFAGALLAAGLHPGDRVAIILPDGPLWAIVFWGCLAAGVVAVPMNTLLKPGEKAAILADCDPRLVVYDPALAAVPDGRLAWSAGDAAWRIGAADPVPASAPTHRDAFAFFLYSSGTTGEPKGVVHLMHDMWVCARTFGAEVLGLRPDDRCFSVAKLFFAYGLGNAQYLPFEAGGSCVLYPGRPAPDAVFAQVIRHRPTMFFAVPTAYAQLLAAIEAGSAHDFSSVRLCVSAGESLPASLFERWRAATGLEILDAIGSTEICHCFLANRPGHCRPGSSGTPVPGYQVRIVDENGHDVAPGQVGDLLVSGDSTMALYWNKHEASKRTLVGDWIRTGDKYSQDEEGVFWHAGRSDDMLKVSGMWVSPVEVESVLIAYPAVLECAVVGITDDEGLVKPHAFVALRPGVEAHERLTDELFAHARERLAPYKVPRRIHYIAELPKTATGKIKRFMLRGA